MYVSGSEASEGLKMTVPKNMSHMGKKNHSISMIAWCLACLNTGFFLRKKIFGWIPRPEWDTLRSNEFSKKLLNVASQWLGIKKRFLETVVFLFFFILSYWMLSWFKPQCSIFNCLIKHYPFSRDFLEKTFIFLCQSSRKYF